jgi:hypothetical protein
VLNTSIELAAATGQI